jgi:hypothetical protein
LFLGILSYFPVTRVHAQTEPLHRGSVAFFDSLDNRMDKLQKQIARLKQTRDVAYYNLQRELDLTIFVKAYEEYVVDEDLDKARELVEARLERAEFRRDQYALKFYHKYQDDAFDLIKQQRMHYQQLFQKNFRRSGAILNRQALKHFANPKDVNLAISLSLTSSGISKCIRPTEAMIFDARFL